MDGMSKREAITRLERQLRSLGRFQISHAQSSQFRQWERETRVLIKRIFADNKRMYQDFIAIPYTPPAFVLCHSERVLRQAFLGGIAMADDFLRKRVEEIRHHWVEDASAAQNMHGSGDESTATKVFVVHGHNCLYVAQMSSFLLMRRLEPVILCELPDQGMTLMEKLIHYSKVAYAVVLLTGDDKGGTASSNDQQPRGRQNVILELGYFLGRLGRERVCLLYEEGVELPSDYYGVCYIGLDEQGNWRRLLERELAHAGIPMEEN